MAIACNPTALEAASECISCALTHKQLLAAMVYLLCQLNNMSCTPASLASASECFKCALTEKQLLAAAVYLLCTINSGGSGGSGALPQMIVYTGADPTSDGLTPGNLNGPAIAYKKDGTGPIWVWNTTTHVWN